MFRRSSWWRGPVIRSRCAGRSAGSSPGPATGPRCSPRLRRRSADVVALRHHLGPRAGRAAAAARLRARPRRAHLRAEYGAQTTPAARAPHPTGMAGGRLAAAHLAPLLAERPPGGWRPMCAAPTGSRSTPRGCWWRPGSRCTASHPTLRPATPPPPGPTRSATRCAPSDPVSRAERPPPGSRRAGSSDRAARPGPRPVRRPTTSTWRLDASSRPGPGSPSTRCSRTVVPGNLWRHGRSALVGRARRVHHVSAEWMAAVSKA